MVNIDTVYQTVLALANKEQRGYITPQEFNLFAEQAQLEIIEQCFYDINQFNRLPKNSTEYSDMVTLVRENLSTLEVNNFRVWKTPGVSSTFLKPANLYKLGSIRANYSGTQKPVELVTGKELAAMQLSPLTAPTDANPVYTTGINTDGQQIYVLSPAQRLIRIDYIRMPAPPRWGFTIVGERAMYNPDRTTDFELHPSESAELVYKILMLAGVTMKKQDVVQSAAALQANTVQQEKR